MSNSKLLSNVASNLANSSGKLLTVANGEIVWSENYAWGSANNANSEITTLQGINTTQNTNITLVQGVDVTQNTRLTVIEGTDATQNTNISNLTSWLNSNNTLQSSINATQNTNIEYAFSKANSSITLGSTPLYLGGTNTSISGLTLTNPTINGFTGNTEIINIGTGQVYKDVSGNFGIGTNSPVRKLHVGSVSEGNGVAVTGSAPNVSLSNADTNPNTNSMTSVFALATSAGNYGLNAGEAAWLGVGNSRGNFIINPNYWGTGTKDVVIQPTSGNVGIGTTANLVYDQVGQPRPLVIQSSSSSTTINGSTNALTICNGDTTTNNLSQLNFAAITGASTIQFSSAIISAIHGARVNGQYPAGQLVFSTSSGTNLAPTEKMRLDSSGNLGLGVTPSAWQSGGTLQGYSFAISRMLGTDQTAWSTGCYQDTYSDYSGWKSKGAYSPLLYTQTGAGHKWCVTGQSFTGSGQTISWNQAMTLDASGNLLVGITSTSLITNIGVAKLTINSSTDGASILGGAGYNTLNIAKNGTPTGSFVFFGVAAGTGYGSINVNGSGVVYNTTSDITYKENIRPITNGLERVSKLKPVDYNWKVDGSYDNGFIAQDLLATEEFAHRCNPIGKNEIGGDAYGVDYMKFVAVLSAAIQELNTKLESSISTINELQTKIQQLEGK